MNTQVPGYLGRLALRAKQPVTGLRPRTAGMFESETGRPQEPFGEALDLSTPTQHGEGIRAADADARDPGLRPAVQRQVEAMPSPAGVEIQAHDVRGALDGAVSAAVLNPPPSLRTVETSATAAHGESNATPGQSGGKPADLRTPNGERGVHQLPRQKASDAVGVADLPPASRGAAPGTPDPVAPSSGQPPTPVVGQHAPGAQPPRGEPERRQSALRPPDPPGLPRLHPSKPEPALPAAGVTVTIGRIEVLPPASDNPPRKPPRPRARPATAPQLSDYLRQRRDGG